MHQRYESSLRDRVIQDYLERMRSHLSDGYVIRHATSLDNLYMCRLKHMANGNEIVLSARLDDLTLTQRTNHVVTFHNDYRR